MKRIRERLRTEMRALRGANAAAVITKLNPIIRGWAAYYRTVVSSQVFATLDNYLWKLTYKWANAATRTSRSAGSSTRYFGQFNKSRHDRWVFGDRDSGAYLLKFAWTNIVRHQMVKGGASPDDPALADYWAERRRKGAIPLATGPTILFTSQTGRCLGLRGTAPARRPVPAVPKGWEQWRAVTRRAIKQTTHRLSRDETRTVKPRLIHSSCRPRSYWTAPTRTSNCAAGTPSGACLSRMRG